MGLINKQVVFNRGGAEEPNSFLSTHYVQGSLDTLSHIILPNQV